MAVHYVIGYRLFWNTTAHTGRIIFFPQGIQPVDLSNLPPNEFNAIATILNETPVFYDDASTAIYSGNEQTGGD